LSRGIATNTELMNDIQKIIDQWEELKRIVDSEDSTTGTPYSVNLDAGNGNYTVKDFLSS